MLKTNFSPDAPYMHGSPMNLLMCRTVVVNPFLLYCETLRTNEGESCSICI